MLLIVTVFDQPAAAFLSPFFVPTRGVAIRSFRSAVLQEGHQFNAHASDYTLFAVGEFDEFSGQVTPYPAPEPLITGLVAQATKEAH